MYMVLAWVATTFEYIGIRFIFPLLHLKENERILVVAMSI